MWDQSRCCLYIVLRVYMCVCASVRHELLLFFLFFFFCLVSLPRCPSLLCVIKLLAYVDFVLPSAAASASVEPAFRLCSYLRKLDDK